MEEKWLRLSELLSPILKWTAGGLPTVWSCPLRRSKQLELEPKSQLVDLPMASSSLATGSKYSFTLKR